MATQAQLMQNTVDTFFQQHPKIPFVVPSSPNYAAVRATFIVDNPAVPLAIARPQNAEDVSLLVSYCSSHGIPLVVRSGGNNLFGRSQVHAALTIDMRDISYCHVDEIKGSAKIGGGILMGELSRILSESELATACGMVPFIGFTGWATYGGYGPLASNYGLGFEQILGARVVNWKGEIVDADRDLLRGIRGAGGSFGVIVEMVIKVYPLQNILTGIMVYDSSDVNSTVVSYCRGLQKMRAGGLPRPLCIAPLFFSTPRGILLASHFMWSDSNEDDGLKWLEMVSKLGKVVENPVRKTTLLEGMKDFASFMPTSGRGGVNTISLRELSDEVTDVIAKYIKSMPGYFGNGFAIHLAPGLSKTSVENSVFGAPELHYMLELLAAPESEEGVEESREWGGNFLHELQHTDPKNVLPATYISLTPPGRNTLNQIYGQNYNTVMSLKEKHDPKNVFNLAVPFSYLS